MHSDARRRSLEQHAHKLDVLTQDVSNPRTSPLQCAEVASAAGMAMAPERMPELSGNNENTINFLDASG